MFGTKRSHFHIGSLFATYTVLAVLTGPIYSNAQALHLGFESEKELLSDFVSQSKAYLPKGRDGLVERKLSIEDGRFGKCLHVQDGWPICKGTWNESGLDCDLIVAVIWGEWHKKPHYWGAGAFHGDSGTVAFWVKTEKLNPGVVFRQGNIAWGRMERDLFNIEVDPEGRLSAFIRDVQYKYHRVTAERPTWKNGEWQHIAVTYDRAYGLKLFHNGRIVGSNWGRDAWWQTAYPGLFSPFLPESYYDEIFFFDYPLTDEEVGTLYSQNSIKNAPAPVLLDEDAQNRLLAAYGDLGEMDIPVLNAEEQDLRLKQIEVKDCRDQRIPAWWVFDGRYELAWPHPYRLFTFILGDADYHGTKIDIDLNKNETPNFISFEGILEGLKLLSGEPESFSEERPLIDVGAYPGFFYSTRVDLKGATALRVPLVKEYGSPPDLQGSAHLPLSGAIRIHEMHLWNAATDDPAPPKGAPCYLRSTTDLSELGRYGSALRKIHGGATRTAFVGEPDLPKQDTVPISPLAAFHLFSSGMLPDTPVDGIALQLAISPAQETDFLWIKLRDPGNPARIWAQTCIRVEFSEAEKPQRISVELDLVDLMLACEDRLWVDIMSAHGGELLLGDPARPTALFLIPSKDPEKSLASYTRHELHPARMQYIREYNYKPWRFTGEEVTIQQWSNFGGPYDMAYPPMAVLRHNPSDRLANIYHTLTMERDRLQSLPAGEIRTPNPIDIPEKAPAWAVWERELYRVNLKAARWIANWQQSDGMFWGGPNDDSFIPLGYAEIPLLGSELTRRAWLRFYEGLEEKGIFADGYCDIWPIDPLHITDFITSRGLMLAFDLGGPKVFERELRTTERYTERVNATNRRLAENNLPPLTGEEKDHDRKDVTLVECMEAEILDYSRTHVQWYWRQTEIPPVHEIQDREATARRMMELAQTWDENALFGYTEALIHTDTQTGVGRDELICAALGGRLQGRIEPYPHSIAVSWEGSENPDLARLVSYADEKTLKVNLYNFSTKAAEITMRVWRLEKGRYEIVMGPDRKDDGTIDGKETWKRTETLRRFSTVPLEIPPQQNMALCVTQVESLPEENALPDLAIDKGDLRTVGEDTLEATVHNIGAVPARNVLVEVIRPNGKMVASQTIEEIGTPTTDFAAKKLAVTFRGLSSPEKLGIRLDPKNDIAEIFEENNTVFP